MHEKTTWPLNIKGKEEGKEKEEKRGKEGRKRERKERKERKREERRKKERSSSGFHCRLVTRKERQLS